MCFIISFNIHQILMLLELEVFDFFFKFFVSYWENLMGFGYL